MKTTKLILSEKERDDILNQIKEYMDREIVEEILGDENTLEIDHYYIKMIDPIYNIEEGKSYPIGELGNREIETPLKLNITGCICYDEKGNGVELSDENEKIITAALDACFYINNHVTILER